MGNRLVDDDDRAVQLRGVNRSGTEYACIQGWGFSDGPTDDASVAAIAAWGANVVRVPLNEDCWLGRNTAHPEYNAAAYRSQVRAFVQRLHRHRLAAILDLQWVRSGTSPATGDLRPLPDSASAPAFWGSVARAFAGDRAVLFDAFNEPHDVNWSCWRDGCPLPNGRQAAGMQSLVNAIRAAGARQPILLGGLAYANDLSEWLAHAPADPAGQLVASFHVYPHNACGTSECWDRTVAPVAARVPVVTGEVGDSGGGTHLFDVFLPWADSHGVGYLAWTWNTWKAGTDLVRDFHGTPTAYGAAFRAHLPQRPAASPPAAPRTAMALLSRAARVHTSSAQSPAGNANDRSNREMWRSNGYPCWVAYDLSVVPAAQRRRVYSVWTNDATYNYDSALFDEPTYNLPGDYVLEANSARGGSPPESGWVTLVTARDNAYHSAAHLLDMTGHNWLRFRATKGSPRNAVQNTDCALKWDVYDASAGLSDTWAFFGDSITAGAMSPLLPDSFAALVNASRPQRLPAQQNAGVGGLTLADAVDRGLLARWLRSYPGKYVALSFGTNDVNSDGFSPGDYHRRLEAAVALVRRAGKVAAVPTLVASRTPQVLANGPLANREIRRLYRSHRDVVPGPDLWSLFSSHPGWVGQADPLHPTPTGYAEIRRAWAASALSSVYRAG